MTTTTTTLRHSRLGLAALALLGAMACDMENHDGLDREAFAAAAQTELDDEVPMGLAVTHTGPQDLVGNGTAPVQMTQVNTYEGGRTLAFLSDGDIILLKSFHRGYVGCDGNGDTMVSHNPFNTDEYVWEVHRTDIDEDGTDELQLESVDVPGSFLKLNGNDEAYCGNITGIGDAAAWTVGSPLAGGGDLYRRIATTLVSYKHGRCLRANSSEVYGDGCGNTVEHIYFFEVIDPA